MPDNRHKKAQELYEAVSEDIREDLVLAVNWALETLRDHEGSGHIINVTAAGAEHNVVCSFAKPSWPGDHSGTPMYSGSEAVVISVCEYLSDC